MCLSPIKYVSKTQLNMCQRHYRMWQRHGYRMWQRHIYKCGKDTVIECGKDTFINVAETQL